MQRITLLLAMLMALLQLSCTQMNHGANRGGSGVVVLDIGHFIGGDGACTPGPVY